MTAASSSDAPLSAVYGMRAAPLSAVDRVEITGHEVVATKRVVASDPYLVGHYPGFPIYPGVFVLETACQAVDALARRDLGASAELAEIGWLRLTGPALPGDELRVHASCEPDARGRLRATVRCTVGEAPVAQLVLHFRLVADVRPR